MPELRISRSSDSCDITLQEQHASVPWSAIAALKLTYGNAKAYGRQLFDTITADARLRNALTSLPRNTRIVLLADGPEVAAIPWEYLRLPNDLLLATRHHLVRGIPHMEHYPTFTPTEPLSIIAVPVLPTNAHIALDTQREWRDLVAVVKEQGKELKLIRPHPPTLSNMKRGLGRQGTNIVQFMGHSDESEQGGVLFFENDQGEQQPIEAAIFANALNERTLFAVLNSCLSAAIARQDNAQGESLPLSNIAEAVVRDSVPYALGMQFKLFDDAALKITESLYQHLLKDCSIEEAVQSMRFELEHSTAIHFPPWLAGVPVL